ncbi:hypothetical protein [Paenibacillus baekrokdamisoli]|nr:hypothetical protein [Paenibacillus baekrokdamisoli]
MAEETSADSRGIKQRANLLHSEIIGLNARVDIWHETKAKRTESF